MHMVDDKTWHRLIDVNLTGTFNGMRAAVPLMLEAGGGAIVNNASVSGMSPTRNEAAYSAAKAAVVSLTKSGALEYGPTIRVNCVSPGHVLTALTEPTWTHFADVFGPIVESIPLGRVGTADEIAEVILFLASDRSSYITGQTLVVDGGIMLPQAGTDPALRELFNRFSE
jgi:NAD(P)-dependent dehydrogenase (short-subunit alcohol dehydrogenase family)